MRELSIKEKAKAYDGLIERLKDLKFAYRFSPLSDTIEEKFPELKKESEDERIRKDIIEAVELHKDFTQKRKEDIYAWLDEQSGNPYSGVSFTYNGNTWGMCARDNGVDISFNCELIQHVSIKKQSESKVKIGETYKCVASPKYTCFREGDFYYVEDNFVAELINICSDCFVLLENQCENHIVDNNEMVKSADGDEDEQNLNEALSYIKDESLKNLIKDRVQLNQKWSDEDELHIKELESLVKQVWANAEEKDDKETIRKMSDLSFFLKTLQPQPQQEWSEEDRITLNALIKLVENLYDSDKYKSDRNRFLDFLKSLKPQNKRKLSSLQIPSTWLRDPNISLPTTEK